MKWWALAFALSSQACGVASILPTITHVAALGSELSQTDWACHPDSAVKPARCFTQADKSALLAEVCVDHPELRECAP